LKGVLAVCCNGLGHFRRSLRVSHALCSKFNNLELKIFCHPNHILSNKGWEILTDLQLNGNISFHEFLVNPRWHNDDTVYSEENLIEWYQKLPANDFENADFVISDNLPGILNLNPATVLMGSFLWSEILVHSYPTNPFVQQFHEAELALLERYTPPMICLSDMVMPYVMKYTQPVPTSWVVEHIGKERKPTTIENILISAGGTPYSDKVMLEQLAVLCNDPKYRIHTSNRLASSLPTGTRVNIFDFTTTSFEEIDVIVGRPGIGTITDSVAFGIPLLALGEDDNPELVHNAKRVEALNFGINMYEDKTDCPSLIKQLNNSTKFQLFQESLNSAPKNGLAETVDFIASHFELTDNE
jgi:hypothetical protein